MSQREYIKNRFKKRLMKLMTMSNLRRVRLIGWMETCVDCLTKK